MNPQSLTRIAEAVAAVASVSDLHAVMGGLIGDGASRWTRTQLLFYLPTAWHSAAEPYFDGERLCETLTMPSRPEAVSAPAVLQAIASAREVLSQLPGRHAALAGNLVVPTVSEVLADTAFSGSSDGERMMRALRAEIACVHAKQPKRYSLSMGRCIDVVGGRFVYLFKWSSEPEMHCPGTLLLGIASYNARVGDAHPNRPGYFEVQLDQFLDSNIGSATFLVDPSFLLRLVYAQLGQLASPSELSGLVDVLQTLPDGGAAGAPLSAVVESVLNARQRDAVRVALSSNRSYTWGPPGTGKTRCVGALVHELVNAGKRVLILSPYNVAVDQALLSAWELLKGQPRALLRLGRADQAVRRAGLDIDSQLEQIGQTSGLLVVARDLVAALWSAAPDEFITPPSSLRDCLDAIGGWLSKGRRAGGDTVVPALNQLLFELREAMRAPEAELIDSAAVVATTMALSFMFGSVRASRFDHIIIDEASVLRTPEALLTMASRAGIPITFFGDPKQLPAIVNAPDDESVFHLGRSPFALCGIDSPDDAHGSCVMLNEQHRMSPPIRSIVSDLFYSGALIDGTSAPVRGQVIVVDTSHTGARSTPKMVKLSYSKENQVHRHFVAEIVRAFLPTHHSAKVLVLSPFSAQRRAYRREPNTARLARDIRFETIHSSQGSEQDMVILDLVLAGSGAGTKSRMLDDRTNRHLSNLLNVGLSRAKGTLVILGDLSLVQRCYAGGLLDRMLQRAVAEGTLVVLDRTSVRRQISRICITEG